MDVEERRLGSSCRLDFLPGAEETGGGRVACRVSSVLPPPFLPHPQFPNHPSVHGSPVKPKAGNLCAILLQNQDLSEHDRPGGFL
jgi:hypothetical protein